MVKEIVKNLENFGTKLAALADSGGDYAGPSATSGIYLEAQAAETGPTGDGVPA